MSDDTIPDSEILPVDCGYLLFRRDRNRHGGGVVILLSNHLPYCPHPDLSGGHVESIWGQCWGNALLYCN